MEHIFAFEWHPEDLNSLVFSVWKPHNVLVNIDIGDTLCGSDSNIPIFYLYDLEQMTQPFCVCFLICGRGLILISTLVLLGLSELLFVKYSVLCLMK